jgi:TPP-dependent pyruvate/acetoin dehydrogenase alpha subunit
MGGEADRAGLRASGGVSDGAQAYRAGIGHREAGSAGAEMVQVGLGYPLADRHAASSLSHRDLLQFLFTGYCHGRRPAAALSKYLPSSMLAW